MASLRLWSYTILALLATFGKVLPDAESAGERPGAEEPLPRVMVGIVTRNTAHTLPNVFGYLEALDYPKERILVWLRSMRSIDETQKLMTEWAESAKQVYEAVEYHHDDSHNVTGEEESPFEMTDELYVKQAQFKQEGLNRARLLGAHYLLWLDCDNFLVNNQTLKLLIEQNKPLIAPMLESGWKQAYSNFWCGQTENGYYKRMPDYLPTLRRERVGCFQVPVIFGTVLISLRAPECEGLVYWPAAEGFNGPVDDVVMLAYSAKKQGAGMFVLNTEMFGYLIRPERFSKLEEYANHFVDFKLNTLVNHPPVPVSQYMSPPAVVKDTVGVDRIYMISLERRPERRNRMLACLNELRLDITLFNAIDGRKLNESYINGLGIHYLPGWKDPWGERPMTYGEVGCFLSHYFIWQQMIEENLSEVLVLEDDIAFEPDFRQNLQKVLEEAHQFTPTWDLIYVGRKILDGESEVLVTGATSLVKPKYSYWTLGYLISLRGVHKLLEAQPLQNLLPVDEFLPIMFDVHPEKDWADNYPIHNLEAYSAYPLLVNPTHYAGDPEWFSDTEPPVEILEQIRKKKLKAEEDLRKEDERREKVKQDAIKRQIQAMKEKLKPKTEL